MKKIRVGLIGLGQRGMGILRPVLLENEEKVEITAVCDLYQDRIDDAAKVIVDAGYNEGNVGDVDHLAYEKASYYTPVPGGVGPMTIASLLSQTAEAIDKMSK